MITINKGILCEIYDSKKFEAEIYNYLCSVIKYEIAKKDDMNDSLVSDCVDEIISICNKKI